MKKLQPGTIETCTIERVIDTGYVLKLGNSELLLHKRESSKGLKKGEEVDVFLYEDKKGELVTSMKLPKITIGIYDWCEVVEVVENLGVFIDIGTTKDILVFMDDLPKVKEAWPQKGDQLFATLKLDRNDRLLADLVTDEMIQQERDLARKEMKGNEVKGRIYRASKIGSEFVSDEGYRGFIHHLERKQEPRLGEYITGRIIEVKDDGTINASLRPIKTESQLEDADEILVYLRENNGRMPFNDKSHPEEIRRAFSLSKAAFKRALGKLLKEGKITQSENETFLNKDV